MGHRGVCFLLSIIEFTWYSSSGSQRSKEILLKSSTAMWLSRNHDTVTQDNIYALL